MASKKTYWRSFEELTDQTLTEKLASKEFAEELPAVDFYGNDEAMENSNTSRRDFLKILGFSTAAVTLAACEAPVIKSIPYVVKPNEVTIGVPTFYASTYFDGLDYANVLVKTREGRPIRIDANKEAKYFGSTNARVQASVLSLYDNDKVRGPQRNNGGNFKPTQWEVVDGEVVKALNALGGKKAYILTSSIPSPSTKKLIGEFIAKYPTAQHVVYDAFNNSAALDASQEFYGKRVLPFYDLSQASLIVGFNADFLGDYNGGGFDKGYASVKKPGKNMVRHIQVETNLSLTGANADERFPKKPTEVAKILAEVYNGLTGGSVSTPEAKKIVAEIKEAGSKAVVLADGSKEVYYLAYAINQLIKSTVLVPGKAILLKEGNDALFNQFLNDAKAGNVGVLFTFQTNPIFNHSKADELKQAFGKIALKVALTEKLDETASLADIVAPVPHVLESWNDFNPITGVYTLQQPTIQRIFNSRQFQDSLLKWSGSSLAAPKAAPTGDAAASAEVEGIIPTSTFVQELSPFYNYIKSTWEAGILNQLGYSFNQALYNGFNETGETTDLSGNAANAGSYAGKLATAKASEWELQLYLKAGIGDGTQGNNPWLQELPDPISRVSWDNYMTINPLDADKFGICVQDNNNVHNGRMQFDGDFVKITANGKTIEDVPVFIQPGQAIGTVGLAVGYGRTKGGKVSDNVGVNAFPIYNGNLSVSNVKIERTKEGDKHEFACMQMQNTLMGRYEIARETSLNDFLTKKPEEWNESATMSTWRGESPENEVDIWRSFDRSVGPHFKLSIDLNSCTGCGACVIACQAENNTAVVGKEEMRRSRDMYWLRIDRYYSDITDDTLTQKVAIENDNLNEPQQYKFLIKPKAENPDVIFQPMMCQHCNHAPCETVCPVAATSHGRQGQNMMAYNRCVGTRYCANNCPYKVRRFNWFNYAGNDKFDFNMNNDLGRMVLNPDVVVRTRGVMEKCSFCIQETQATILKAKRENRTVTDKEFQDSCACAAACGSDAMIFGDINDDKSRVKELSENARTYVLLEEIGTKPNVLYQVKVRNRQDA